MSLDEKDKSALVHKNETAEVEEKPHPDEHQIKLDTDRSFVLYPVCPPGGSFLCFLIVPMTLEEEETKDDRERLQEALYSLIVSVFRRHPGLSYFQVCFRLRTLTG